jgi:hypothetical protein
LAEPVLLAADACNRLGDHGRPCAVLKLLGVVVVVVAVFVIVVSLCRRPLWLLLANGVIDGETSMPKLAPAGTCLSTRRR